MQSENQFFSLFSKRRLTQSNRRIFSPILSEIINCRSKWIPSLLLFSLLSLVVASSLNAQQNLQSNSIPSPEKFGQSWSIESFSDEMDLTENNLFFMDLDQQGVVWFATSNGLYRYDGYVKTRFTERHGLPSNFVRCVLCASDGKIWIGTDKGAGVFDPDKKSYDTVGSEKGMAGPCVRRIYEDAEGGVWFCSDRWPDVNVPSGLSCFKDGVWSQFGIKEGLPSDHIQNFFRDSQGNDFVLTNRGVAMRSEDGVWRQPLVELGLDDGQKPFWSIVESPEHGVLISSSTQIFVLKEGSWKIFPSLDRNKLALTSAGQVVSVTMTEDLLSTFSYWNGESFEAATEPFAPSPTRWVRFVQAFEDGTVWCGATDMLTRWQATGGEWREYQVGESLFEDEQGRIWFSGEEGVLRNDQGEWDEISKAQGDWISASEGNVWNINRKQLLLYRGDQLRETVSFADVGFTSITSWRHDSSGNLWLLGPSVDDSIQISVFGAGVW